MTANDDEMIILLMFVARLQVTILKRLQTANDSVRYSWRSAVLALVLVSDYHPYFVRLAPFACRVLVHIS